MPMLSIRLVAVLGAVMLLLALSAGPAAAHAALVSSDPAAGQRLATAPGLVVLRFTEPLNTRLSGATVTGPNGQRFQGAAAGAEELRVRLLTNIPGVYRVAWATVSVVDGHSLRGRFAFGVGVTVGGSAGGAADGSAATGPRLDDGLIAVGRAVEDLALLVAVGMLLLASLARRNPPLARVRPRVAVVLAVALGAGLVVVTAEAAVASAAASGLSARGVAAYLTSGVPGWARLGRVTLETVALLLASPLARWLPGGSPPWRRWGRPGQRLGIWLAVAGGVVALAASGHAAGAIPTWWGITADAVHLLAAGLWAGGILALATLGFGLGQGRRGQGHGHSRSGPEGTAPLGELLTRFAPVALAAFVVSAGLGVVQAFQQVGTIQALLGSAYGRTLGIKVVAIAAMLPLSVWAWRHRPALRTEALLGVVAVALAALLAAYPFPPARLARAEAQAERAAPDPSVPRPGDLTLAGHVGPMLVGLTIRPATPGRNDLWVYLLPVEGELAAATIPVAVAVDGQRVPVQGCGLACHRSAATLSPGSRIQLALGAIGRVGAGVVSFDLPLLPAPDGSALLARVQQRMHRLRSLRYSEVLASGLPGPPLRSTYEQQAPDRLRVADNVGFQSVWIGTTTYIQRHPGEGWLTTAAGTPYTVPSFVWDQLPSQFVAPRIVGAAQVDGVATRIVSFYGPSGAAPAWFRLWVDPTGLVRRAQMRANGHFMDQHFGGFDAPLEIQAPPLAW